MHPLTQEFKDRIAFFNAGYSHSFIPTTLESKNGVLRNNGFAGAEVTLAIRMLYLALKFAYSMP